MCDDLNEELEKARVHANGLAEHLANMGAASATLEANVADERYVVTIRHIPVIPEDSEKEPGA